MKKKEVEKLRNKNAVDLKTELADAKEKLRTQRFEMASGKVKNTALIRETKKRIARINTFLSDKK